MRLTFLLLAPAMVLIGPARAQRGQQPALPPLLDCGTHGDLEILCGTRSPEDLEVTPDGKFLIVSQFVNAARGGGAGAGLVLFDPGKKTFTRMAVAAEPLKNWGDPACPGPIGDALAPHGISLLKRADGKYEVFV